MTKMIKMSLVAAVAVAGLTTTSSAVALEEAIKGTELTGYVRYRLNTTHTDNATKTNADEEAKAVLKFTTKVNDNVKANLKFVSLAATSKHSGDTIAYVDGNSSNTAVSNITLTDGSKNTTANTAVTEANFVINAGPATLIAGLQTTQSPFAANNGDTRSHGVTALVPAGPVTVAAAHYTTTVNSQANVLGNSVTTDNLSALGVIGKFGPVNAQLWMADLEGEQPTHGDVGFMALLADTKAGPATVSLHHAETSSDAAGVEISNTQLVVSSTVANIAVFGAYATTGKTSGDVTADGDSDSKLISGLETINTKTGDASVILIGASAPVGPVKLGLTYLDADVTNTSMSEYKFTVGYAMSKNFNISAFYDSADTGAAKDTVLSRIEVKYTF